MLYHCTFNSCRFHSTVSLFADTGGVWILSPFIFFLPSVVRWDAHQAFCPITQMKNEQLQVSLPCTLFNEKAGKGRDVCFALHSLQNRGRVQSLPKEMPRFQNLSSWRFRHTYVERWNSCSIVHLVIHPSLHTRP